MAKITKRMKAATAAVQPGKAYSLDEALKIVKDNAKAKFAESVDVAVRLGIDAKKSDQGVRGSSLLPHGTGKTVRVAVFVPPGEKAEAALAAGADAVGMDDLAEKMQAGDLNYGRVIATPDAMRVVGKLGQVLGPRGLMPNPKDELLLQKQSEQDSDRLLRMVGCNGGVLWTRGLSILQLVVLEGRWDTVVQCVW